MSKKTRIKAASMRPRRIRRGNARRWSASRTSTAGFNEAAANSPRKHRREVRARVDHCGFNEAAANSPRKHADEQQSDFLDLASMRPRRIRRGNGWLHRHGDQRHRDASMRPRRIRRGNLRSPARPTGRNPASMRPRRIRRGNTWRPRRGARAKPCFNEAAANSPRKRASSPSRQPPTESFNEAAANSPRKLWAARAQTPGLTALQ